MKKGLFINRKMLVSDWNLPSLKWWLWWKLPSSFYTQRFEKLFLLPVRMVLLLNTWRNQSSYINTGLEKSIFKGVCKFGIVGKWNTSCKWGYYEIQNYVGRKIDAFEASQKWMRSKWTKISFSVPGTTLKHLFFRILF